MNPYEGVALYVVGALVAAYLDGRFDWTKDDEDNEEIGRFIFPLIWPVAVLFFAFIAPFWMLNKMFLGMRKAARIGK